MSNSKLIEGLDCETTARAGVRFVLRAKLEQMCALREAALDFSDIEGVHKMRVASRRLRSALRDFQPYLAKPVSPSRLKAVARALGRVRDEDVAIEMMDALVAEADEDAKEGIARLARERRVRREKARAALYAAIDEDKLAELHEKFTAQLDRAAAEPAAKSERDAAQAESAAANVEREAAQGDAPDAPQSDGHVAPQSDVRVAPQSDVRVAARSDERVLLFADVGGRVVRARFRELKESARSLYRPYEVEPLHEMRIRAKRLRYSIELFTQCWGEPLAPYAAEIAKLQEYLGELHDCDVWIDDLGKRLGRRPRARRREAQAAERRAAAWLLRHFSRARAKHYGKALALWDGWEAMDFASSLAASVEEARARLTPPVPAAEAASEVAADGQTIRA